MKKWLLLFVLVPLMFGCVATEETKKTDAKTSFYNEAVDAADSQERSLEKGEAGIIAVSGNVTMTMPSGSVIEAKEGRIVPNGTKFVTDKDSSVQVAYTPSLGKSVLIEEKTEAIVTPEEEVKINIKKGKVFAILDKVKPGEKFQFETPHAIAGVRGTRPEMQVMIDATIVYVHEGEMGVLGLSMDDHLRALIPEGEKAKVLEQPDTPVFLEPLSDIDRNRGRELMRILEVNIRDFRDLHGGAFKILRTSIHAPKKKGSGRPVYDTAKSGPAYSQGYVDPSSDRNIGSGSRADQIGSSRPPDVTRPPSGDDKSGGRCP
ncbi:MAG: FecR domain-containing protein [Candidatus Ancaeobacter aquaticus]|nr:FecR domain-containing protein [Candidatus Ancaeobacter aquaticus]